MIIDKQSNELFWTEGNANGFFDEILNNARPDLQRVIQIPDKFEGKYQINVYTNIMGLYQTIVF